MGLCIPYKSEQAFAHLVPLLLAQGHSWHLMVTNKQQCMAM
jgi:hypothetical protein